MRKEGAALMISPFSLSPLVDLQNPVSPFFEKESFDGVLHDYYSCSIVCTICRTKSILSSLNFAFFLKVSKNVISQ